MGQTKDMPEDDKNARRFKLPLLILTGIVLLSALAGSSLGYFMRLDLPDVNALQDYTPPVMSRVLADNGELVDTFAEQRRILIDYREIPRSFIEALISTEDANFFDHTGIDAQGIARAAWNDLRHLRLTQGASTLTMQLARDLFLHKNKTFRRKLQEALLALEIERSYTKEEILRFYCNQVYMGHGRYGIEAASRYFFGKPALELTLPEAAMLAGIIQRPEALTPVRHPERALKRRDHVLSRMVSEGYLTEEKAAEARKAPIILTGIGVRESIAPYFVEDVRRWLKTNYGDSSIYQDGLEVHTTLDLRLQRLANNAMDFGLRQLDKRQGFRGIEAKVPEGEDPVVWELASWKDPVETGGVYDGIVLSVDEQQAVVRIGQSIGYLEKSDIAWTRAKQPMEILTRGDIVRVRLVGLSDDLRADITLEQEPLVEASIIALDPRTGEIKALVGGFDFERSEWNRATQARRQTGSAFKPFVYAAALASGMTLADRVMDEPTVFLDRWVGEPYQPENYSNRYYGNITLRRALEKSANIATVKVLHGVGYDRVIELARRTGISSRLQPFPSLALGSFEVSLLELTAAYGTFANQGVWVEPHLVEEVRDRDGGLLTRIEPRIQDAVNPRIAFLINRCLEGVVTDGTGKAAASLGRPLAGKTGTTDDNTDAWFIGYAPDLAVGVWVGFDDNKSLGSRETGALAALPIWKKFMETAYEGKPVEDFETPAGIVFVAIDRNTGMKANPSADCPSVYSEAFEVGTEPTAYCSRLEHRLLEMPYPLQRYSLNERGRLEIPEAELHRLLTTDLSFYLTPTGDRIVTRTESGKVSVPLSTLPGGEMTSIPDRLKDKCDPTEWNGKDGRRARIVLLGR